MSQSEAQLLVANIKRTPNIIGYSLQEWLQAEQVMVAEDEGTLVGACLNYDFHHDWRKIAALIVFEDFRGQAIGRKLFYQSFNEAVNDGRNVYTVSANPIVLRMMDELALEKFKTFTELLQKHRSCRRLFCVHTIFWILNFYRIKELIRKWFVYQNKRSFTLGVKLIKGNSLTQ